MTVNSFQNCPQGPNRGMCRQQLPDPSAAPYSQKLGKIRVARRIGLRGPFHKLQRLLHHAAGFGDVHHRAEIFPARRFQPDVTEDLWISRRCGMAKRAKPAVGARSTEAAENSSRGSGFRKSAFISGSSPKKPPAYLRFWRIAGASQRPHSKSGASVPIRRGEHIHATGRGSRDGRNL